MFNKATEYSIMATSSAMGTLDIIIPFAPGLADPDVKGRGVRDKRYPHSTRRPQCPPCECLYQDLLLGIHPL